MFTEASDYDTLYREFPLGDPGGFVLATVCCDRHTVGSSARADLCRRGRSATRHLVR